jgi:uncharacterized membrane protein
MNIQLQLKIGTDQVAKHVTSKLFWDYLLGLSGFMAYLLTWQKLLEIPAIQKYFEGQYSIAIFFFASLFVITFYVHRKNTIVAQGIITAMVMLLMFIAFMVRMEFI